MQLQQLLDYDALRQNSGAINQLSRLLSIRHCPSRLLRAPLPQSCNCQPEVHNSAMFIPRKDWLVYLTYDQAVKPSNHDDLIPKIYTSNLDNASLTERQQSLLELSAWMTTYCKSLRWM